MIPESRELHLTYVFVEPGVVFSPPPSITSLSNLTLRRLALALAFNPVSLDVLPYCHTWQVNLSLNIHLLLLRTWLHFLTLPGLSFQNPVSYAAHELPEMQLSHI